MCFKAKYFMFCCEIFRFQKEIFMGKKQQRGCGFLTATPLLFVSETVFSGSIRRRSHHNCGHDRRHRIRCNRCILRRMTGEVPVR